MFLELRELINPLGGGDDGSGLVPSAQCTLQHFERFCDVEALCWFAEGAKGHFGEVGVVLESLMLEGIERVPLHKGPPGAETCS